MRIFAFLLILITSTSFSSGFSTNCWKERNNVDFKALLPRYHNNRTFTAKAIEIATNQTISINIDCVMYILEYKPSILCFGWDGDQLVGLSKAYNDQRSRMLSLDLLITRPFNIAEFRWGFARNMRTNDIREDQVTYRGVGSALLAANLDSAISCELNGIILSVSEDALGFYDKMKLGYVHYGNPYWRIASYYHLENLKQISALRKIND